MGYLDRANSKPRRRTYEEEQPGTSSDAPTAAAADVASPERTSARIRDLLYKKRAFDPMSNIITDTTPTDEADPSRESAKFEVPAQDRTSARLRRLLYSTRRGYDSPAAKVVFKDTAATSNRESAQSSTWEDEEDDDEDDEEAAPAEAAKASDRKSVRRRVVGGERSSFSSRWSRRRQAVDTSQPTHAASKWGKTGGVLALLNPVSWSAFTGARESRVSRRSGWSGGSSRRSRSNERRVSPEEANQSHQGEVVKIASKLDSVDSGYNSILDDLGALAEARKALEQTSSKSLNDEKSKP